MSKGVILKGILAGVLVAGLSFTWLGCGEAQDSGHDKGTSSKHDDDHDNSGKAGETATKYVCPMSDKHPKLYDKPGECEQCGMALVPVKKQGHHAGGETAGHGHQKAAAHDGQVIMTKKHHFEVVFHSDGVHVYLYDANQKPISFKGVSGTVTLKNANGTSKQVALSFEGTKDGVSPDYLEAEADLSNAKAGKLKAVISFSGLAGQTDPITATYTGGHEEAEGGGEHGH